MKFLCQLIQKFKKPEQTDKHTHRHTDTHRHDENITSTAYAGGKKQILYLWQSKDGNQRE